MKTFLSFLFIFLCLQCIGGFIAWVGGYNFDQRGFWVAYFFMMWALVSSLISAVIVATQLE